MVKVFLCNLARETPSNPWAARNFVRLRKAAESSTSTDVAEARHPDDADMIAFVEPRCRYQSDVMLSSMYRRYSARAVVIDSQDNPVPLLPG
ncbi:MAG: hypothetical protein MUE84_07175, partial [Hyphomonas sp.]|nr:hypothetical protein [Hyphomonas sp.]